MTSDSNPITLGYVIIYVEDVAASLTFYEQAFGLKRRFFTDEGGMAYGELETGATRLAFASLQLAEANLSSPVLTPNASGKPLAFEVALVTTDVNGAFASALKAGAKKIAEPTVKPWGQIVAYLTDPDGTTIELCSPLP